MRPVSSRCRNLLITNILLLFFSINHSSCCWSWSFSSSSTRSIPRRAALDKLFRQSLLVAVSESTTTIIVPQSPAWGRNLPQSTGADTSQTATLTTLLPILQLRQTLQTTLHTARVARNNNNKTSELLNNLSSQLSSLPRTEAALKRLLDAYSTPVSYKQTFLDQNAFLVYYTQGFDGPNRPKLEDSLTPDETKQTQQYGLRNELWIAYQNVLEEIEFAKKETQRQEQAGNNGENTEDVEELLQNIQIYLEKTLVVMDQYLALAPQDDVQRGLAQVQQQAQATLSKQ